MVVAGATAIRLPAPATAGMLLLVPAAGLLPLLSRDVAGDGVFGADPRRARRPSSSATLATTTVVDGQDLSSLIVLVRGVVDLRELEAREGVGEGGQRNGAHDDLGLQLVPFAEAVEEPENEIVVVHGAADGGEVIGDRLQLAGIRGDGLVTAWNDPERLAQKQIARGLVV
jgi:hypothetical protein